MSLPHPNIVFTPLTTITAQDHNNQMANVASLADGTGVNDGAIVGGKLKNSTVTADKIDFTTIPAYNYSSEEINTGHKWVNKKPIYQKSITFNTTGSGAEETGANNENFSYIDTLISLDAILNMPNGERYPNSYTNPSAPSIQYFQLKFANWNNAQVLRYQTRSVGTVTMTIRYTKK